MPFVDIETNSSIPLFEKMRIGASYAAIFRH